jgi:ribosomal protein L16/L10AE
MLGIKKKTEILRKNVKVSFRKYPNLLLTRKSTGHRMGKGKGKFSARIAKYKKGEILFEVSYFDLGVFDNIFKAISKTFPVPVEIVERSPLILKA